MTKVRSEGTGGMRGKRAAGLLVTAVAAAAGLVPLLGAEAGGHGGAAITAAATPASCSSSPPTACARTRSPSTPTRAPCPASATLLRHGAKASGNGLLTQAPPNTGAGWFTLATGAWPGVAGSTNNTFHVNGQPFGNSTSALGSPNVLQAETLAQSAERGGKKVAQIEWAGGRAGTIAGPTLDFRNFRSGRGVATNYIAPTDDAAFTAAFGLQFDHPAGLRRPAIRSRRPRRRTPRAGRTCPSRSARRRRCACACSTARPSTSTA